MKRCTVEHLIFTRYSAATEFRCGGRFYFTVFRTLSTNPKVKELLKLVHICQSYRKSKSGPVCSDSVYMRRNIGPAAAGPAGPAATAL